jgi:hypothetical protein
LRFCEISHALRTRYDLKSMTPTVSLPSSATNSRFTFEINSQVIDAPLTSPSGIVRPMTMRADRRMKQN